MVYVGDTLPAVTTATTSHCKGNTPVLVLAGVRKAIVMAKKVRL